MQCHLQADELNALADALMEDMGLRAAEHRDPGAASAMLDRVLARDLRFDTDEFDLAAQVLAARKQRIKQDLQKETAAARRSELQSALAALERALEKIDEACAMF